MHDYHMQMLWHAYLPTYKILQEGHYNSKKWDLLKKERQNIFETKLIIIRDIQSLNNNIVLVVVIVVPFAYFRSFFSVSNSNQLQSCNKCGNAWMAPPPSCTLALSQQYAACALWRSGIYLRLAGQRDRTLESGTVLLNAGRLAGMGMAWGYNC